MAVQEDRNERLRKKTNCKFLFNVILLGYDVEFCIIIMIH